MLRRGREGHLGQFDLGHLDQGGPGRQQGGFRRRRKRDSPAGEGDVGDGLLGARWDGGVEGERGHLADGGRFVLGQQPFGEPAVLLALGVLLDCVLDADLPAREELSVHLCDCCVGAVEVVVADEAVALAGALLGVARDLGADDHAEVAECLIEEFLIDFWVQVADEDVGSDILGAFVLGGLVDLDGFSVEFDHVHDLDGVVGVLLALELDEAVALVLVGDLVARDVDVDHWSALREQLPEDVLVHLLVDVPRVHRRLLVPLVQRWDQRHPLIYIGSRPTEGSRGRQEPDKQTHQCRTHGPSVQTTQAISADHKEPHNRSTNARIKYYSYQLLFLARIRAVSSSLRQVSACSEGMAVSSPSEAENMSGLWSLHSPKVQTRSSLLMKRVRKMRLLARRVRVRRRTSSMARRMNCQLLRAKSPWYFSRYSSKVNSCGSLSSRQVSPWVSSWYSRETAASAAPRCSISRYTPTSWLARCMRSPATSLIATPRPTCSSTATYIRQASRVVTRERVVKRSSREWRMMMDSSMMGGRSREWELLVRDLETMVSLSQMLSSPSPCFFLSLRRGESLWRSRMLDCVGLNSAGQSTQSRSQFDRTYFISRSSPRSPLSGLGALTRMLWASLAQSLRKESSFLSSREQLWEKSEYAQAGGAWLQLLQLSLSRDSEASSLRSRDPLSFISRVLRRLYSMLLRMLSSALLRPLLRRKLDRLSGLKSASILGSLLRCDSSGRLACVVRVVSFRSGRKPSAGMSSSAGSGWGSGCGSTWLGLGDISAQVILLQTMRGESQSSLRVALRRRESAALELERELRRACAWGLVRESPLAGERVFWAVSLIETEMPVRRWAEEWLSMVWRCGASVLAGEESSRQWTSWESTRWLTPDSPRWQWLMVWQILTVLQRLNISPASEILDLLIIMTHFIYTNKYINAFPLCPLNFIYNQLSQLSSTLQLIFGFPCFPWQEVNWAAGRIQK